MEQPIAFLLLTHSSGTLIGVNFAHKCNFECFGPFGHGETYGQADSISRTVTGQSSTLKVLPNFRIEPTPNC